VAAVRAGRPSSLARTSSALAFGCQGEILTDLGLAAAVADVLAKDETGRVAGQGLIVIAEVVADASQQKMRELPAAGQKPS
jgi:hypothetical protein